MTDKYKLEYTDNEISVVHQFPGTITAEAMRDYLIDFLAGCSWNEKQIRMILNLEE